MILKVIEDVGHGRIPTYLEIAQILTFLGNLNFEASKIRYDSNVLMSPLGDA